MVGVTRTRNVDAVRSIGADHVLDYTKDDFAAIGQRYDLILAANGDRSIWDYKRALTADGAYAMTGGSNRQLVDALLFGPLLSVGRQKLGNSFSGRDVNPFGPMQRCVVLIMVTATVTACGATARLAVSDGTGPQPVLPSPRTSVIPTVNVISAKGWPPDGKPVPAQGTTVSAFARDLDHPRWLYVLPNGDVLVAETNAPPRPEDGKGIKGWFFKRYQKKAGGAVPSANRISYYVTQTVMASPICGPFCSQG